MNCESYLWAASILSGLTCGSLCFMAGAEFMKWLIKRQSGGENWLQWHKIIQIQNKTIAGWEDLYRQELEKHK